MSLGTLTVNITGNITGLKSALSKAENKLNSTSRRFSKLGQSMARASAAMGAGVTAGLGGAIKASGDFEQKMNEVFKASGNAFTTEGIDKMADAIRKNGVEFNIMEQSIAAAKLASAGFSETEIPKYLADVAKFAKVANVDIGNATDVVASFAKNTGVDLKTATDQLTTAFGNQQVTFSELIASMGESVAVAQKYGVTINELVGAQAALAAVGIKGQKADNQLAILIGKLNALTDDKIKKFKTLGVEIRNNEGKMNSFTSILEQFKDANISAADGTELLTETYHKTMVSIATGSETFIKASNAMQDATGATEVAFKSQGKTFNEQMSKLRNSLVVLAEAIGSSGLLEFAAKFADKLTKLVIKLSDTENSTSKWVVGIGLAVAALAPLAAGLGLVVAGLSALIAPIGAAIGLLSSSAGLAAALVAVSGTVAVTSKDLRMLVSDGFEFVIEGVKDLTGWFGDLSTKATSMFSELTQRITKHTDRLVATLKKPMEWLQKLTGEFDKTTDEVVRNSYWPELVDGVIAHTMRLQNGMVRPVKEANEDVRKSFKETEVAVSRTVDEFSGITKAYRTASTELKDYNGYQSEMSKKLEDNNRRLAEWKEELMKSGTIADQSAAKLRILAEAWKAGNISASKYIEEVQKLEGLTPAMERNLKATQELGETLANIPTGVFDTMVDKIGTDGSWSKAVKDSLKQSFTDGLKNLGKSLFKTYIGDPIKEVIIEAIKKAFAQKVALNLAGGGSGGGWMDAIGGAIKAYMGSSGGNSGGDYGWMDGLGDAYKAYQAYTTATGGSAAATAATSLSGTGAATGAAATTGAASGSAGTATAASAGGASAGSAAVAGGFTAIAAAIAWYNKKSGEGRKSTKAWNRLLEKGVPTEKIINGVKVIGQESGRVFVNVGKDASNAMHILRQKFNGGVQQVSEGVVSIKGDLQTVTDYVKGPMSQGWIKSVRGIRTGMGEQGKFMVAEFEGSTDAVAARLKELQMTAGGTFEVWKTQYGTTMAKMTGDTDAWASSLDSSLNTLKTNGRGVMEDIASGYKSVKEQVESNPIAMNIINNGINEQGNITQGARNQAAQHIRNNSVNVTVNEGRTDPNKVDDRSPASEK